MSSDRRVDPVTGDFARGPGGSFTPCDPLENKLAFSFLVPLGSWEGDPTLGHRLDELQRGKMTDDIARQVELRVRAAAQWLLDAGEIVRLEVEVEIRGPHSVAFEADAYPPGRAEPVTVGPFLIAVGA